MSKNGWRVGAVRVALAAGLAAAGVGALLVRPHTIVAGPAPGASPRSWAKEDLRLVTRKDFVRAHLRLAALCHLPINAGPISIELVRAANARALEPAIATFLSCVVGAPASATCADISECSGVSGVGAKGDPVCDGDLLRVVRARTNETAGISCSLFGGACFHNEVGSLCGEALCKPGETYSCDGDSVLSCQEGVRSRGVCGRGMTCGRSPGSRIIDCIGKGGPCTEDRCDGDTLVECALDAFGKGLERVAPCGDFGFTCSAAKATDGVHAGCAPRPGGCNPDEVAAACVAGSLSVCIAGVMETFSCSDLGLSGACSLDGGFACK